MSTTDNQKTGALLASHSLALALLLLPALSVPSSLPLRPTTYYVDCSGGMDSNAGTAASEPWRTLARVNQQTFAPGDSILLRAGGTWREELLVTSSGKTEKPVTFGSYGSGPSPVIDGADLITNWTPARDPVDSEAVGADDKSRANIWQAAVPTRPYAVWVNDVPANGGLSTKPLSFPGQWYWANQTLYIYSRTSPVYQHIEAAHRDTMYVNNARFVTFLNLHFDKGGNAYSGDNSITIRASDNVTFDNCMVTNSVNIGIDSFSPDATTGDLLVHGCVFVGTGESSISSRPISSGAPSAIQTFNTGRHTTLTVEYSTFRDIDAWGGHHGHGVYDQSGNLIWRYNFHYGDGGTTQSGSGAGAAVRIGERAGVAHIYGNIFSASRGRRYWGLLISAGDNYVTRNVFEDVNYGIVTQGGRTHAVANTFCGHQTWWYVDDYDGSYSGDYNSFNNAQNGWIWDGKATIDTLTLWKTISSQDVHSGQGDVPASAVQ